MLQNHGLLTSGGIVAKAAAFIVLDRASQTQLLVESSIVSVSMGSILRNMEVIIVDYRNALYFMKRVIGSSEAMYMQFEPEYQLILKERNGEFP